MIERPKIAVITFLGSLDDHDAAWSLAAVDAEPQLVWHGESKLPKGTAAGRAGARHLQRLSDSL